MATQDTNSKKRLAIAIIDFLNSSLKDGTVSSEDAESIEIATSCIAESFKVDPHNQDAVRDAIGGQSLLNIYSVFEKAKGKSTASTQGASSATGGGPATPQASGAGADAEKNKAEAEKLKAQGNAAMQQKNYNRAVDLYTQALNLNPLNPIYLSNRAAAYSATGQHEDAKGDAEMAVAADPKFAKAWSRLGLAKFALGDARGSMEAYKKGIDAEGSGGSEAMRKGYETAKRKVEEEGWHDAQDLDADDMADATRGAGAGAGAGGMPDLSSLAGMFGGGAGGAGGTGGQGGGMPNFAEMMNNPMMRQMAQNLMSNPDTMNNLLNNPQLREMAGRLGGGAGGAGGGRGAGGGGMPDLSSLMQDPALMDMARNFMGGAGGPGRGAGRGT